MANNLFTIKQTAGPIRSIDNEIKRLEDEMLKTMSVPIDIFQRPASSTSVSYPTTVGATFTIDPSRSTSTVTTITWPVNKKSLSDMYDEWDRIRKIEDSKKELTEGYFAERNWHQVENQTMPIRQLNPNRFYAIDRVESNRCIEIVLETGLQNHHVMISCEELMLDPTNVIIETAIGKLASMAGISFSGLNYPSFLMGDILDILNKYKPYIPAPESAPALVPEPPAQLELF